METSPNGITASPQHLAELRRQCLHHNVFPIFLPNTFYGEAPAPVFKVLSKLVAGIADQLECLDDRELQGEVDRLPSQLQMLLGEMPARPWRRDQHERIALYQIVWMASESYSDFPDALVPFSLSSEVGQAFPELADHIDEEGLLRLGPNFVLHDGGINYKQHVLHFHQCLRRNFSSNPNFNFTARFCAYYREYGTTAAFRIAIDPRRFMHQSQYQQMMEFDAWHGPMFDPSRLDDLDCCGLTLVERERPSLFDFSNKLDRTEFYWAADRSTRIKSFEIEELPAEDTTYGPFRISRYVHSERDTNQRCIRHLDGAVKVYESLGAYRARYASQLPKEPRAYQKHKLFRIDGQIPIDAWIDLIAMFYNGNEMVLRYFDSNRYEASFRDQIQQVQELLLERKRRS
ncbi:MAG: hypothetical protein IAE97_03085 [Chthoniobacterales bacterium]|nr:hypothetical protein [Chthoniobacterales bacterium]